MAGEWENEENIRKWKERRERENGKRMRNKRGEMVGKWRERKWGNREKRENGKRMRNKRGEMMGKWRERKWGNREKRENGRRMRKWRFNCEKEKTWRASKSPFLPLSPFPHSLSLSIFSFSLHFLSIFSSDHTFPFFLDPFPALVHSF